MAVAPVADVVRAWAGLATASGVNLQRAARVIVERRGPRASVDALEALPVGPYTARAVAAIFRTPVGAVDTNVRRVPGLAAGDAGAIPARDLQAWRTRCRPIGPATGRTR